MSGEKEAEKVENVISTPGADAAKKKKNKKKKNKNKTAAAEGATETPVSAESGQKAIISANESKLVATAGEELKNQLKRVNLGATEHPFWKTQPVPSVSEVLDGVNTYIHPPIPHEELQHEPYALLDAFCWEDCNIDDDAVMKEIYTLLNENYVEDDDNMFRFDYSQEFLRWALKPPGFRRDWHVGVRVKSTRKLVGFITAIPATLKVYDKEVKLVEINFLCVHKKLRSKRLAPLLIREITRRVHVTGLFQAVYTAGVVLPTPVASCRYWHRSLNPKKLIEVRFSHLAPRMTMARTIKLYKLDEKPITPGIRELKEKDVPAVHKLLSNYLKNYDVSPIFSEDEIHHWLLPRPNIINSYVVEDPVTHEITDLASFYTLPSTILGNTTYNTLKAAYCFYNVAGKTPLVQLMNDALIFARNDGFDVFNALDIFENQEFMKPLKFGIGDGHLQYYLYNWKCPPMAPQRMGLVLL